MFKAITEQGITKRAIASKRLTVKVANPRDYTTDKHRTVDDKPYGGGPGMVMMVEPILAALKAIKEKKETTKVIYVTPQGKPFNHKAAQKLAKEKGLIIICGRYEGIDERIIDQAVDEEYSIGDYVLTGGELPAMVMIDAITRWLPGALGDPESAKQDTFEEGILDYPHYTRPREINGQKVPEVLCEGNHKAIKEWRMKQAIIATLKKRPDLLEKKELTEEQKKIIQEVKG